MFKYIIVAIAIVFLCILSVIQYYIFTGFDELFMGGLILNLTTEAISILITVLIVDKLLRKQQEKEQAKITKIEKESHEKLIKEIIGNNLTKLFSELSSVYVNFVTKKLLITTKEDQNFSGHERAILDVIENIDDYVRAGFRSKPIKTIFADPSKMNEGISGEQLISYQVYCSGVFRSKIEHVIEKFVGRYISILPDDLRKALYRIENSVGDFVFVTVHELGFKNTPMPTREEDIKQLKKQFLIIGQELTYIYKLIK